MLGTLITGGCVGVVLLGIWQFIRAVRAAAKGNCCGNCSSCGAHGCAKKSDTK